MGRKVEDKVIGYQVVNDKKQYFPGYHSFIVLSLSMALREQAREPMVWRLLPIREGDIENPTFVGEGFKKRRKIEL